jgi:Rrf2 family protein
MAIFEHGSVHISAKTDYAIRALVEIAAHGRPDHALTAESIASAQGIPVRFLLNILADLRRVGLVDSRRGPDGGWWLARPANEITVADAVRAVDGPLTHVAAVNERGAGLATALSLTDVWLAVRSSVKTVLEGITLADLAAGDVPRQMRATAADELSGRQDRDGDEDGVVQEVGEDRPK